MESVGDKQDHLSGVAATHPSLNHSGGVSLVIYQSQTRQDATTGQDAADNSGNVEQGCRKRAALVQE